MNAALAAARLDRERRARVKAGPSEVPQGAGSSVGNVGNAENDATLFFSFFFLFAATGGAAATTIVIDALEPARYGGRSRFGERF